MASFLSEHGKYFIGAVLVHLAIAAIVAITALTTPHETIVPALAIQAVVVDRSLLEAPARRDRARQEAAERRRLEEERQREEQRQQEEAERTRRQAEQAREIEAQRAAEQRKQQEQAERQRQADAERKERADAERQEREQDRVAEIKRKQQEAEQRRRSEAEQRAQAMAESDLQRQIAEEEGRDAAANSGQLNQYVAMLQQRFVRNWNRPPSARPGIQCKVTVTQAPGGTVLSAQVGECNGDAAVKQSIEAAVLRSSPLPAPPDPRLFERTLILWFKPVE